MIHIKTKTDLVNIIDFTITQDESLFKPHFGYNKSIKDSNDACIKGANKTGTWWILGYYTKKKAEEILDEIYYKLDDRIRVYKMPPTDIYSTIFTLEKE